ncbi:MAG: hypothetical protein ACREP7_18635 [Lysobacter sp.]
MPHRQGCRIVIALLSVALGCGEAAAAVPVIEATPACAYRKLGTVEAEAGARIKEDSMDKRPSPASYVKAFDSLSKAAQSLGANAVVLRSHRATYFTYFGRRTREAVHIDLSGAAIHIEGDPAQCAVTVLDPNDYRRAGSNRGVVETTSDQAYRSE